MRGLAKYARDHDDEYQRSESIIKINDFFYSLNLKDKSVQDAVEAYRDAWPRGAAHGAWREVLAVRRYKEQVAGVDLLP